MSRIVQKDFEALLNFVKGYSATSLCEDKNFVKFLSSLHKKFYAYLVLAEELRAVVDDHRKQPVISPQQLDRIIESVSDCGQCLFLAINGCYKGSRLLLRSSIENFLKGICLDEIPNIVNEKSVYQVFDDAGNAQIFKTTDIKDGLHDIYALLCQDAHTADRQHMASVTAMKFFPHFQNEESSKLQNLYLRLVPMFVTSLCIKYREAYHAIGYEHRDIILTALIDDYKPTIHGVNKVF